MKTSTVVLVVGGVAVLAGVAFLILRNNKQAQSISQQALSAPPPVSGVSRGVASGSGVQNIVPPPNKGYGDKIFGTASNILNLGNAGFDLYKKAIA